MNRVRELIDASLPGYCLHEKPMLPASYFNLTNGALQYVGPSANAGPANPYLGSISKSINVYLAGNWPLRRDYWADELLRRRDHDLAEARKQLLANPPKNIGPGGTLVPGNPPVGRNVGGTSTNGGRARCDSE